MHIVKLFTSTSLNILNLKNIPLFTYTQFRQQPRKTRQYRQQEQSRHYQSNIIDRSYWDNLLPKIEPPAAKLVKILTNPSSSKKQISRQLQSYLQFRNFTFTENVRTDLGCVSVLIALNQCKNSQNNDQYQSRIIDFITLSDTKNSQYDRVMLKYIIMGINKRLSSNVQKNIKQYYRMKLVQIVQENFERLDNKDMSLLVSVIQQSIEKDKMNFITKWRLYPLIQSLSNRIFQLMETYVNTKQFQVKKSIDVIIYPYFYVSFMRLIFFYGHISHQHAEIIERFQISRSNQVYSDQKLANNFFNVLCYMPFTETITTDDTKTTFKKKLLGHFQTKYEESSLYRRFWNEFSPQTKKFTFQRFFEQQFHAVFKSLPFEKMQDKYLLLKKQHLVLPQIPQFVWRLFKQNEKTYMQKMILNHCIKTLYPNRVSLSKSQTPDFSQRNLNSFSDNQINLKIWEVLTKLGYKFKKEQICCDRQVDLLIDENIILEVDGEGHYTFLTKELGPETTFRNLHLLLSGYKLVIVSMFQYNIHRSSQALEKLVKEKLDFVKNHDYIYVC